MFTRISVRPVLPLVALLGSACFQDIHPSDDEIGDAETDSDTGTETGDTGTTEETDDTSSEETGPCDQAGCACESPDDCADGLQCVENQCTEVVCGDGEAQGTEQCDDGNANDGDGCDNDCTYTEILAVDAGGTHTCVLIEGGRVRCWGASESGQLGLGGVLTIGDDELPSEVGDVSLPAPALQVSTGAGQHTCALLEDMSVRCWGLSADGQLGYGNTDNIGDNEPPSSPVAIGGAAVQIVASMFHTCARLETNAVRCWGRGALGRLGYGSNDTIGDNELPSSVGDVPVGGPLTRIAAGGAHTCGTTINGALRCWGRNEQGQLGYGNLDNIGDDEPAGLAGDASIIPMGLGPLTKAIDVTAGVSHTCALFETGDVLCWGDNSLGQLGIGSTAFLGDDELPSTMPPIELPAKAVAITAGGAHTCALLEDGDAYCWGSNGFGQLGYGNINDIGDDEPATAGGPLDLGGAIVQIDGGFFHTCALNEFNEVRCWGNNDAGQLGLGNTLKLGDDELPIDGAPVSIF